MQQIRFQDTNCQVTLDTSRGFPCVLRLIEHYSAKYADMNVVALRYPVLRDDMKIQDGIGECLVSFFSSSSSANSKACFCPGGLIQ